MNRVIHETKRLEQGRIHVIDTVNHEIKRVNHFPCKTKLIFGFAPRGVAPTKELYINAYFNE